MAIGSVVERRASSEAMERRKARKCRCLQQMPRLKKIRQDSWTMRSDRVSAKYSREERVPASQNI